MIVLMYSIWLCVSHVTNGNNLDDSKVERSCYHNPAYYKSNCLFNLNYNPLRLYLIKDEINGKMYYIPSIDPNYCSSFENRYHKYPAVLASRRYGVRLIRSYHNLLNNYCINTGNDGKYYFVPSESEIELNNERGNMEHNVLKDYCKEHYRHVDFLDPNSDQETVNLNVHLPDINSRLMKPYKIPVSIKRNVDPEGGHKVLKKQLDEKEDNKRFNGCPHSNNGMPCDTCRNGGFIDFPDKHYNCDICEEEKMEPIFATEYPPKVTSFNELIDKQLNDLILQECDDNKEIFRTENNLIAWQSRIRLQDPNSNTNLEPEPDLDSNLYPSPDFGSDSGSHSEYQSNS